MRKRARSLLADVHERRFNSRGGSLGGEGGLRCSEVSLGADDESTEASTLRWRRVMRGPMQEFLCKSKMVGVMAVINCITPHVAHSDGPFTAHTVRGRIFTDTHPSARRSDMEAAYSQDIMQKCACRALGNWAEMADDTARAGSSPRGWGVCDIYRALILKRHPETADEVSAWMFLRVAHAGVAHGPLEAGSRIVYTIECHVPERSGALTLGRAQFEVLGVVLAPNGRTAARLRVEDIARVAWRLPGRWPPYQLGEVVLCDVNVNVLCANPPPAPVPINEIIARPVPPARARCALDPKLVVSSIAGG